MRAGWLASSGVEAFLMLQGGKKPKEESTVKTTVAHVAAASPYAPATRLPNRCQASRMAGYNSR